MWKAFRETGRLYGISIICVKFLPIGKLLYGLPYLYFCGFQPSSQIRSALPNPQSFPGSGGVVLSGSQAGDHSVELIKIRKSDHQLALVAGTHFDADRSGERIGELFFQTHQIA